MNDLFRGLLPFLEACGFILTNVKVAHVKGRFSDLDLFILFYFIFGEGKK